MFDLLKFKFTALDAGAGAGLGKLKKELKTIDGALATVKDRAMRTGRSMRNLGTGLSVGLTAPLTLLGKQSVKAFDTQVKAQAAVQAAIKSTGAAAGFSAGELSKMAAEFERTTTFGDEDVLRNLTAPLLTFTKVQGDVFREAQGLTLDMATLLQMDLKSAAIQVGKALNDPIAGITALSRAGVSFSDTQKQMIKDLVATGDAVSAQRIILDELAVQFGGQAEAAAATPLGQWAKLSNAIGTVKEQLGEQIVPFLEPILENVKSAVTWFSGLSDSVKKTIVVVGGLAAAVGPLVAGLGLAVIGATGLVTAFTTIAGFLIANPFVALAVAVGGVVVMIRNAITDLGGFDNAMRLLSMVGQDVFSKMQGGLSLVGGAFQYLASSAISWMLGAFATIAEGFTNLIQGMSGVKIFGRELNFEGFGAEFAAGLRKEADGAAKAVDESVEGMSNAFEKMTKPLKSFQEYRKAVLDAKGPETLSITVTPLDQELNSIEKTLKSFQDIGGIPGALSGGGGGGGTTLKETVDQNLEGLDRIKQGVIGLTQNLRGWGDLWKRLLSQFSNRLMEFALDRSWGLLEKNMANLGAGGGGGGAGGLLFKAVSWLFGGEFAKGAAFSGGNVVPFARGGVVSSPTMFPMSRGRTGLMGEAGPEAIMPLARVGGKLGVRAMGQGGGDTSITINVDARGATDPEAVRQAAYAAVNEAMPSILAAAGRQGGKQIKDYHRRGNHKRVA